MKTKNNQINLLTKKHTQTSGTLAKAVVVSAFLMVVPSPRTRVEAIPPVHLASQPVIQSLVISQAAPKRISSLDVLENRFLATQAGTHFNWKRTGSKQNEIQIVFSNDSLFQKGSAEPAYEEKDFLKALAQATISNDVQIKIESHTDDTPVIKHRKEYASNWELSAARAGAVARIFEDAGFNKSHLQATGLADSQPLGASQETNRRVVLRFIELPAGGT